MTATEPLIAPVNSSTTSAPVVRMQGYQPPKGTVRRQSEQRETEEERKVLRFPTFRPDELLALDPTDEVPILSVGKNNIWMRGSVAAVLGGCGIGKSRWVFALAVSDILQRPFCGFETYGAGRWLFITPENSHFRMRTDYARLAGSLDAHQRAELNDKLIVAPYVPGVDMPPTNLDAEAALAGFRLLAAEFKPDVVVVDPWEEIIMGGNANESAETRQSVARLQGLYPCASLLIVHHAREGAEAVKAASGFNASAFTKGSKSLTGRVRVAFNLTPLHPPTESAEKGHGLVIHCGKVNDGTGFSTRAVKLDETNGVYVLDKEFDPTAYRLNVDGKFKDKAVPIRAVVDVVRRGTTKARDIIAALRADGLAASDPTMRRTIADACKAGILKSPRFGVYELGPEADTLVPRLPDVPANGKGGV